MARLLKIASIDKAPGKTRFLAAVAAAAVLCLAACNAGRADDGALTTAPREDAQPALERHKLRYAGKTFEQWRDQLLYDLEPQTEIAAIQALAAFGENGYAEEASAEIAKVLRRKNQQVVQMACTALGGLGKPAVPFLAKALESDIPPVRSVAAQALGQIGHDASGAVPALLDAARDQSPVARVRAANRSAAGQAIFRSRRAQINNQSGDQAAANALGRIGIDDEDHLRELIELFEDATPAVRAALVGGFYGNRLKRGDIRFLIAAMDDEDESLRAQVAGALAYGAADDENVRYVIEQMIHNDTNQVRDHIVKTLVNAQQTAGAAPVLVAALRSRDIQTRHNLVAIIQAIGREGPMAAVATDALIELIDVNPMETAPETIAAAMDALGSIGPGAEKAAGPLSAWTTAKDQAFGNGDRLSLHAQRALRKITSAENPHARTGAKDIAP